MTDKKGKKKGPKQKALPGMDDRRLDDLHEAAEEYADIRDQRMALTPKEVELKSNLLKLMKRHGKKSYHFNGLEIDVIVESEKVRVHIAKPNKEEE